MTLSERMGAARRQGAQPGGPSAPAGAGPAGGAAPSAASPGTRSNEEIRQFKQWLIGRVSASFENPIALKNNDATRKELEARLQEAYAGARVNLPESARV